MFRKRLVLLLSLAMFATLILIPPINVFAEEDVDCLDQLKQYDIQLDGLEKDGFVYVFKDEIRDISVVSDVFYNYDDVQVKWEPYVVDRETGEYGYELFEYNQEGSATNYQLNGSEVEYYTDWNNSFVRMRVTVCIGDYEFASEEFTIDYFEKESYYYEDTQEVSLIPGAEKLIRGEISGYIRDQYYPYGESVYCKVTDVTVLNTDVCSVYQENNDFRIVAESIGSTEARVTYYDNYGQERSYNFTIHVNSDVIYLDISNPSNTDCMIPYQTKTLTTSLRHEWYNSDGKSGSEIIDDYVIQLTTDEDGNPAYDQELIDVSLLKDGKTLEIDSKDRLGESDIFLNTDIQIDYGNETVPVSTSEKVHVNIVDRYYYSEDFDYNADIKIGETENICPTVKSVRAENGEILPEDYNGKIWFHMDYNNDEFAVSEIEDGIAITRKVDYKTRLFIRCMVTDENGAFQVFGKWIEFNEVDHEWDISYEWSEDSSKCDAKAKCKYDDEAQFESVLSEKTVKASAKCEAAEIISYSASFKNPLFATQTKELKGEKALGHVFSEWIIKKDATAIETGLSTRTCKVCNKIDSKTVKTLTPTITLSATKKQIKKKKSYVLKIAGLAKGDSVVSVKSNKKKIAVVKKKSANQYKISGKKKGKATITVLLKSGKKATCKITVK